MANCAPLALPCSSGNSFQWGAHAINVVRDITLIAQNEVGLVMLEAAALANGAVEASPSFLQNDFGHSNIYAMWVITFATLGASYKSAFEVSSDGSAHHANVLFKHKIVMDGHTDHFAVFFAFVLHARLSLGTLEPNHSANLWGSASTTKLVGALLVKN